MDEKELYLINIEFQTLREELLQGKKYIFERPLLIISLSVALLQFFDKSYLGLILFASVSLLTFNLWFTVNRMDSITRIVAYIQLELEEQNYGVRTGWETCLRQYRIWTNKNVFEMNQIINENIEKDAVPKSEGYYTTIFYMHIGVVTLAFIASIYSCIKISNFINIVCFLLTTSMFFLFSILAIKYHPDRTRFLIERHRSIWKLVFQEMQSNGIK